MDPFSKERGPTVPITRDPKELFSLFLGDDVVDLIVRETNTYAEQCLAETGEMWCTQQLRSGHALDSTFWWGSIAYQRWGIIGQRMRNCTILPLHLRSPAVSLRPSPDTCILQTTGSYHQGESQGTIGYRKCSLSSRQRSSTALPSIGQMPKIALMKLLSFSKVCA